MTNDVAPRDLPGSQYRRDLAGNLLLIGARTAMGPFGWAHPDCETLAEAARILLGEPYPTDMGLVVLSETKSQPEDGIT